MIIHEAAPNQTAVAALQRHQDKSLTVSEGSDQRPDLNPTEHVQRPENCCSQIQYIQSDEAGGILSGAVKTSATGLNTNLYRTNK